MDGPTTLTDWLVEFAADARGVRTFCDQHDLDHAVRDTIQLAQRTFPPGSRVELQVKQDPESDELWLVVSLALQASVEVALEHYGRFVEEWVRIVPAAARDRIRFSFSFD
jgi:hypothetical protein